MNTAKPALAESSRESLQPSVESPSGLRAEECEIRVTVTLTYWRSQSLASGARFRSREHHWFRTPYKHLGNPDIGAACDRRRSPRATTPCRQASS